jgi:hypothetical protein
VQRDDKATVTKLINSKINLIHQNIDDIQNNLVGVNINNTSTQGRPVVCPCEIIRILT